LIICQFCNCPILKPFLGTLTEKQIALYNGKKDDSSLQMQSWFWVVKDMFHFENIGFSKTLEETRYLTCADCERGIIGVQYLNNEKQIFLCANLVEYGD